MSRRFEGKVVVISGAARGQGAAEARAFAAEGATVVLGDVLDDEGEAVAAGLGDAARYRHLDVVDEGSWQALVAELDRIDVLVNNAGVVHFAHLTELELDDFRRVLDVNVTGTMLGMKTAAPALGRAGGGAIVNISSISGLKGAAETPAYVASKWAVRGLTKAAAVDLAPAGIRVNSVHPGVIDTELLYENPVMRREDLTPVLRAVPLGRMAQPAEVATLALFLASDESSYCTGGEFVVDGGVTAS
jgi:3alpha(or 20beta)-hydroxysteroid dehydrogenase